MYKLIKKVAITVSALVVGLTPMKTINTVYADSFSTYEAMPLENLTGALAINCVVQDKHAANISINYSIFEKKERNVLVSSGEITAKDNFKKVVTGLRDSDYRVKIWTINHGNDFKNGENTYSNQDPNFSIVGRQSVEYTVLFGDKDFIENNKTKIPGYQNGENMMSSVYEDTGSTKNTMDHPSDEERKAGYDDMYNTVKAKNVQDDGQVKITESDNSKKIPKEEMSFVKEEPKTKNKAIPTVIAGGVILVIGTVITLIIKHIRKKTM